ncbi:hypothetical protein GQR58_008655 [Nymphon striatum]|nr:hypothetical protein GQR58_008655 [Nymphon striatum]
MLLEPRISAGGAAVNDHMDTAGEVKLLFVQKMLHWDASTYSSFESISMAVGMAGMIIGIVVMSRVLKIKDHYIGIIGAISGIVGYALVGNAHTVWLFYLGELISIYV